MVHALGGRYDPWYAIVCAAGGRSARPGPPPLEGGPSVNRAQPRRWPAKSTGVTCEGRIGGRGQGGGAAGAWGRGGLAACGGAGVRGKGGVSSAAERHRQARGGAAAGAGQRRPGSPGRSQRWGGRGQRWGLHLARRGRILPSIIHGGESWWRRGERHAVPSRPNRTGTGPAGGIPGGRAGLGSGAPSPGSRECAGRRGGDQAGPRAAPRGGGGRAVLARGRTPRGVRGMGHGPRGRPLPGGAQ